jgi:NNP family nitrate/nitrite transporter-like MFS transporter
VGIAYSSVWFTKARQGTALGIFGAGNAGSAITSMGAPFLLKKLTTGGSNLEAWRMLPKIYAVILLTMAVAFFLFTHEKKAEGARDKSFVQMLAPLRHVRVWRFGLYYFLVFGCFVALAQWLIPYYVGVYGMSLAMAGLLASLFSLPSGLIRAAGGWMSDRFGARAVMYWTFGLSIFACAALMVPRMSIESPGPSVLALVGGVVSEVGPDHIVAGDTTYSFRPQGTQGEPRNERMMVLPESRFWQTPVVKVGDRVKRKQLLASGTTHVFFQANVWIFTFLVFLVGIVWGIGKAAVYRYIPDYFPDEVGVVGGIVGVIGGLGGFVGPILFGYLLKTTGLWTSMWLLLTLLSITCLVWLHTVVRRLTREQNETLFTRFERPAPAPATAEAAEPA